MNCDMFNKNQMAYIENDLPYSVKEEMREHIEKCERCRDLYEKKLFIRMQFSEVLNSEQLAFSSVKQGVMSEIKNKEYKVTLYQKLCNHFRRFGSNYVAAVVMIAFVILVVPNMGGMMKKASKKINAKDETCSQANLKASENLNGATRAIMPSELKGNNDTLDKVLNDIKAKSLGVGPWKTAFADNNRIYFYNYSHLLVCDNSIGKRGITGAVDLIKLDLGSYQGSSLVQFIPSNNGNFCVIANYIAELDMINNKKPLYMYNAKNNNLEAIGQENLALIKTGWSNSSQYFAYGDIKGNMITIYDTDKMIKQQPSFNKGEIKKLFVADNGDVVINSGKVYLLKKENGYKPIELKINGEALGFKDNEVIFFDGGLIYRYDSKGSIEINKVGKDYELYKEDDKNIIFNNGEKIMVYAIKSNKLYEYSSKYLKTSKNLSPDFKNFIDNDASDVKIISSSGEVNELIGLGNPYEYLWSDNSTLVRVPFKENPKYLGDFVIERIDIKTGKKSIIYEMK